jgi:hypothetical protein
MRGFSQVATFFTSHDIFHGVTPSSRASPFFLKAILSGFFHTRYLLAQFRNFEFIPLKASADEKGVSQLDYFLEKTLKCSIMDKIIKIN